MSIQDYQGRYYEYVIEQIKEMIASGELKDGEKIPSERELAERFEVSRVPIREALKILEFMGILDSSRGDGTYLRSLSAEEAIRMVDFAVTASGETMIELLELRMNLEGFAAYHAARRRTKEDLEKIYQTIRDMREAKKTNPESEEEINTLRDISHNFHREVVRAAHNKVLLSVYENLYELLDISRQFTIDTSGISYNSILAHEALYHRIAQQDAEGARRVMLEHLQDVHDKLEGMIDEGESARISS